MAIDWILHNAIQLSKMARGGSAGVDTWCMDSCAISF